MVSNVRRNGLPWTVAVVFLVVAMAGCLGAAPPQARAEDGAGAPQPAWQPIVVVAGIDTGINPYNTEFRDTGPLAFVHPSRYLPNFPEDAIALDLTLDAEDYVSAVLADCDVWLSVEPGRLYWFPGTRIVGGITTSGANVVCNEDQLPGRILDRNGHGTMIASRAVGANYSLCPECRFVAVQGISTANMAWAAKQPWIDMQTNSWGTTPEAYLTHSQAARDEARMAAATHPTFVSGGNGIGGFNGVIGHPVYYDTSTGPEGIIMVGGHDGGRYTPWTATMPHVVADAIYNPAAAHNEIEGGHDRRGSGTSSAAPFAAGTFARMVWEARHLVEDVGVGVRQGALVVAGPNATLPARGPLADGVLTVEEARTVFFHTANPRPVRDGDFDGPSCDLASNPGATCILYPTTPVQWSTVPQAVPAYYFVGYGQVGNVTLPAARAVLEGVLDKPDRDVEDAFFGFDEVGRRTFDEQKP